MISGWRTSKEALRCAFITFAVAITIAPAVLAQQIITGATVAGRVEDPTGAVVRNAAVNMRNPATNQNWPATSDASGTFRFGYLPAGNYELTISAPGFAEYKRAFALSAGQAFN